MKGMVIHMDFGNNNNSYNHNPQGYSYRPPVKTPGSSLANASMMLGMIAIITAIMMTIYFPFIFGSLAILFALLSKGQAAKLVKYAKTGLICGIVGIVITLGIITSSVLLILSNPQILTDTAKRYDKIYEQAYGIPSEEIFGDSLEDIVENFIEGITN